MKKTMHQKRMPYQRKSTNSLNGTTPHIRSKIFSVILYQENREI